VSPLERTKSSSLARIGPAASALGAAEKGDHPHSRWPISAASKQTTDGCHLHEDSLVDKQLHINQNIAFNVIARERLASAPSLARSLARPLAGSSASTYYCQELEEKAKATF
jgi:hypothetical protein